MLGIVLFLQLLDKHMILLSSWDEWLKGFEQIRLFYYFISQSYLGEKLNITCSFLDKKEKIFLSKCRLSLKT